MSGKLHQFGIDYGAAADWLYKRQHADPERMFSIYQGNSPKDFTMPEVLQTPPSIVVKFTLSDEAQQEAFIETGKFPAKEVLVKVELDTEWRRRRVIEWTNAGVARQEASFLLGGAGSKFWLNVSEPIDSNTISAEYAWRLAHTDADKRTAAIENIARAKRFGLSEAAQSFIDDLFSGDDDDLAEAIRLIKTGK